MTPFLEIGLMFGVATLIACVMQRARLPLLLGYIVTGVVVGPVLLNLTASKDVMEMFSKLGITALLFIVGIGLNPRALREIGKVALVAGLGQILFTSVLGFWIAGLLGFAPVPAAFLAFALALSSTIIVMKLLSDRGDEGTLYGQIAVGILLVQDVVAMAALVALSSSTWVGRTGDVILHLLVALVGMGLLVYLTARTLLPRLARAFAASQEFLLLFTVGWGVGLASLFHTLGLSAEIGALVAGISLASSPFRHEISAKMKLLRDFFLVAFFILLGSHLTGGHLAALWLPIVAFSVFVLIGNPLIVMALLGLMGYTKKTSFYTGIAIAQVSEFSFVFLLLARDAGRIPPELLTVLTGVGLITMAGSSLLVLYADPVYRRLAPVLSVFERRHPHAGRRARERFDAFVFGCHRVGEDFLKTLSGHHLTTLVVDFDPGRVERLKAEGVHARYGDAHDSAFVDGLDVKQAKLVISTIPDQETQTFLIEKVRRVNPRALFLAVAQTADEAHVLYDMGADYVIMPHYLGGNYAAMLLERHGNNRKKFHLERERHLKHLATRFM